MLPAFMAANAPSAPIVTARRSSSLPTQAMTKSWPSAAAAGVDAVRPPNFSAQVFALAGVRLNTVTSWPPLATRCPAMGKPMTPRPRKATLAMFVTLGFRRPSELPNHVLGGPRLAGGDSFFLEKADNQRVINNGGKHW